MEGRKTSNWWTFWGVLILLILMLFAAVYRRALRRQGEVW